MIEILALIIAICAAAISLRSLAISRITAAYPSLITVENNLITDPNLLNIYGINSDLLKSYGIEPKEFAYIYQILTVLQFYERAKLPPMLDMASNKFLVSLFENKKAQDSWRIFIKPRHLLTETHFVRAVDDYLEKTYRTELLEVGSAKPYLSDKQKQEVHTDLK